MTNSDVLRNMDDKQLAHFLCLVKDKLCFACSRTYDDSCDDTTCEEARLKWLQSESKGENKHDFDQT